MFRLVILFIALGGAIALPTSRIIGGRPANTQQFPYQVSIEFLKEHHCGGSILSPRIVITAAHCTDGFMARFLTVRAGSLLKEDGGQTVKVENFINHLQFHKKKLDYDVSILLLSEPLVFGPNVGPIQLPYASERQPTNAKALISGWGRTEEKGKLSQILRYAEVEVFDREVCESRVAGFTDRMICAGDLKGGVDACTLDSGGPMVVNGKLVGLISWGIGCGRPNSPGVYTHVASLRNWIDNTITEISP